MALRSIGAWCGAQSLASPERDVEVAVRIGLDRLVIVVNDHSAWRRPTPFTLRGEDAIYVLARTAQAEGLTVDLMTWMMPHEAYIREAARRLLPLQREIGCGVQFDLEEPWTKAVDPMPYPGAAALIAQVWTAPAADTCDPTPLGPGDRSWVLGANGIGYTPSDKVGPVLEVVDEAVVQAYSTRTSGVAPDRTDNLFLRWLRTFNLRHLTAGLAAYRQEGIPGYSERDAILTAADEVAAAGADRALYWHLDELRTDQGAREAVSVLCVRRDAAGGVA